MKTFKQFLESFKDLPVDKIDKKVEKLHGELSGELKSEKPGSLFRASKLVRRVGKMKNAVLPSKHYE